jgi:2,3-bisphosphoglycerate-independent phosphoglycerate mutase
MKYAIILGDGMADEPVLELGGKTPLQAACKPNMDYLARNGEVGLAKTTPDSMPPGSDVTNLAIMGYDPEKYYTGRSSLEAVSIGIPLADSDVTFRCNLVTLSDAEPYEEKSMVDYSSDEISTDEARALIEHLGASFNRNGFSLYTGFSYRHCLKWENGLTGLDLTPPHDILERKITQYLPKGAGSEALLAMMKRSYELLKDHPVNLGRVKRGLRPANSAWFWGEAKKPVLPAFHEKHGKKGAVISAVDLIKGIGICAGLKNVEVEGATGNIDTNYAGKAEAALRELSDGSDFVYVHIEAPDECGHRFEVENKVKSIEYIDQKIIRPILDGLDKMGEAYSLLILPDHPTPLRLRTHTKNPVPYILYRSVGTKPSGISSYNEESAGTTGIFVEKGYTLIERLFEKQEDK